MLYIRKISAHGFQTLQDDTEVFYQMAQGYSAEHARGVRWNDPAFGIEWLRTSESSFSGTRITPTSFHENGRKYLNAQDFQNGFDPVAEGHAMLRLIAEMYPFAEHYRRRVAGNASALQRQIPLELREVPRAPRCSIGPCRKNGTFATRT